MQQEQQQQTQQEMNVSEWPITENSSIFIKRIPSWITKEMLETHFKEVGEIDRIHIVDVSPEKGNGRMAFIHFNKWYNTLLSTSLRYQIIFNDDNTYHLDIYREETGQKYTLHVTFNQRPIPKTVYDNDQLSDMINKLNQENTMLKNEIQEIRKMISEHMRIQYAYQPQPTMYYHPMVSPLQYYQPSFFVPEDGSK